MVKTVRRIIFALFTLLFFLGFYQRANAQDNPWLKRFGGDEDNIVHSLLQTPAGEMIMTGAFNGGNGVMLLGGITLKSEAPNNFTCGYIAKLDASGRTIWGKVLRSNRYGSLGDAVLDTQGNIYVVGSFHGVLTFGNSTFTESSYSPQNFIAKYDASGNPLWLKYIPGEINIGVLLCIDNQNNLYLACQQGKRLANGIETTKLVLYKYDSNGAQLLETILTTYTSTNPAYISDIIVDANQQPVIAGHFMSSIKIGNQVFEGRSMVDSYLLKCNADGSIKWATQIGKGELFSSVHDMTFDEAENIYLAGGFSNKTDQVSLVLKYNPAGEQTWKFSIDRNANTFYRGGIAASAIKINNKDNSIVLAGGFSGNVAFGRTQLTSQRKETEYDAFLAKVKADGVVAGAIQSTGDGTTSATQLLLAQKDAFYLAGHTISSSLRFSDLNAVKAKPVWDIFLYKANLAVLDTNEKNEPDPDKEEPDPDKEEPAPKADRPLTLPNILTPNGDDKNQYFRIANLDLNQRNSLEIFNRWGKSVYYSKSYQNDWEAAGLADGTYYYVLYVEQEKRYLKGWVNVVR